MSENEVKQLAKGTFGQVNVLSDNELVKTGKIYEYDLKYRLLEFTENNLIETCFLSQYHHPMITKIYNIQFKTKTEDDFLEKIISFNMQNKGTAIEKSDNIGLIIFQSLYVLTQLHELNLIHADIKPPNILIDSKYNLTLIDFGSIIFESSYLQDNFLGTNSYTAPESTIRTANLFDYKGPTNIITQKMDIFSLGLTFYSLYDPKYKDVSYYILFLYNLIEFMKVEYLSKFINNEENKNILKKIFPKTEIDDLKIPQLEEKIKELKVNLINLDLIKNLEIKDIIRNMIDLNYKKRKSVSEILENKLFDQFFEKKSKDVEISNIVERTLNSRFTIIPINKDIKDYKYRNQVLKNLLKICDLMKDKSLFVLSVKLTDVYFTKNDVNIKTFKLDLCCIIQIVAFILKKENIFVQSVLEDLDFDIIDFYDNMLHILKSIDYICYEYTFDKRIKDPDYNLILKILEDNIGLKEMEYLKIYEKIKRD